MSYFKSEKYNEIWPTSLIVTQFKAFNYLQDLDAIRPHNRNTQKKYKIEDVLSSSSIKKIANKAKKLTSKLLIGESNTYSDLNLEMIFTSNSGPVIKLDLYTNYDYFMIVFVYGLSSENFEKRRLGRITLMDPRIGCSNVSTPSLLFGRPLSFSPKPGLGLLFQSTLDLFISPIDMDDIWMCVCVGINVKLNCDEIQKGI